MAVAAQTIMGVNHESNSQDGLMSRGSGVGSSGNVTLTEPQPAFYKLQTSDFVRLAQIKLTNQWVLAPNSAFCKRWDMVTCSALLFTATITPYEVAFLAVEFDAVFVFNRIIDLIFITDLVLQFWMSYEESGTSGSRIIKDRRLIMRRYLRSWFTIDIISVIPFDLMGLLMKSSSMGRLKALRIIRLLRLLKMVRMARASRIIERWQTEVSFPFAYFSMARLAFLVLVGAHWAACAWGLTGVMELSAAEPGEAPPGWIGATSGTQEKAEIAVARDDRNEEVLKYFDSGQLYLLSLYWSVMTITSIGYGDLVPQTNAEHGICLAIMCVGAVLWAFCIGSFCGMLSRLDAHTKDFQKRIDEVNRMIARRQLPAGLKDRVRYFFWQSKDLQMSQSFSNLLDEMSPQLQQEVTCSSNSRWLLNVYWLQGASDTFAASVSKALIHLMFAQEEKVEPFLTRLRMLMSPKQQQNIGVGPHVDPALLQDGLERNPPSLYILERGAASTSGKRLSAGDIWGQDFFLRNARLRHDKQAICLTFVELLALPRPALFDLLNRYEGDARRVKRQIMILALCRGVSLISEIVRKRAQKHRGPRKLPADVKESQAMITKILQSPEILQKLQNEQVEIQDFTNSIACLDDRIDEVSEKLMGGVGQLELQVEDCVANNFFSSGGVVSESAGKVVAPNGAKVVAPNGAKSNKGNLFGPSRSFTDAPRLGSADDFPHSPIQIDANISQSLSASEVLPAPQMKSAKSRLSINTTMTRSSRTSRWFDFPTQISSRAKNKARLALNSFLNLSPENDAKTQPWIMTTPANSLLGSIIMMNCICLGLEADNRPRDESYNHPSVLPWYVVENIFVVIFLLETILRLKAERLFYFKSISNLFDFSLVAISVVDTWILTPSAPEGGGNIRQMNALRILRLLRLVRVLRLFRLFKELWMLLSSLAHAAKGCTWLMVLLTVTCYTFAVMMTLHVGQNLANKQEPELRWILLKRWGTVDRSMFTLFTVMTAEGWNGVAEEAMLAEPNLWLFFVPFLCLTNCMIMNFMVGIIVDKITESQRREMAVSQLADQAAIQTLASIFFKWDLDHSGRISAQELKKSLSDQNVRRELDALDIFLGHDPFIIMHMFDKDEDGFIDLEEFIKGMMQIKNSEDEQRILLVHDSIIAFGERTMTKLGRFRSKVAKTNVTASMQKKVLAAALDANRQVLLSAASSAVEKEVGKQLDIIRKKVMKGSVPRGNGKAKSQ